MADMCTWTGASSKKYVYKVCSMNADWLNVAGNYIFVKENPKTWSPIYVGETESFKDRLPNHNELPCITRNGGTHIHAHINNDNKDRLAEEKDLLDNYTTPCNG